MKKQFYFLSPIEVVKVTSANLAEVAEWCGGVVGQVESRRVPGRMDSYVSVPTPNGNKLSWAFPGMYVTKRLVVTVKNELKATWAVFQQDYFSRNYFDTPSEASDKTWEREVTEKSKPARKPEVVVNVNVGDAMKEAMAKVQASIKKIADANGVSVGAVEEMITEDVEKEISEKVSAANGGTIEVNRSAETGQFVTDEEAEESPETTVTEVIKVEPETGEKKPVKIAKAVAKKTAKKAVVKKVEVVDGDPDDGAITG